MGCNCEPKKYSVSMGCCTPVLGPIENYYTKYQIDKMLEEIESGITSGCCITEEEVDEKIESAKTEIESEIPSLSGYATEQWVLDKHYISGVDLSDYYTKEEVDELIPTVPTSNTAFTNDAGYLTEHQSLDEYATEAWVLNKHYITGVDLSDYVTYESLPDLSVYATKQWVINQNYALNAEMIQYITNLQNQIDSLKQQISGCCGSTGETITRWITMTGQNDYTCSGTTKMTKEKEQQSTDGGNTWTDTGNYRPGSTVLEENCADCGYVPISANGKIHFYRDIDSNTATNECITSFTDVSTLIVYPRVYEFSIADDTVCGMNGKDYLGHTVRSVCSVIMPDNTRVIETNAFANESAGEGEHMSARDRGAVIALNEGLEQIGSKAFHNYLSDASRLADGSIIIPSTVTSIGLEAFNLDGHSFNSMNQSGLKLRFYFKSQTPPSMLNIFGTSGSQMNSVIRIYVPTGTTDAYRQALGGHYSTMEIAEYDGNITYMSDVWSYRNLQSQGLIPY